MTTAATNTMPRDVALHYAECSGPAHQDTGKTKKHSSNKSPDFRSTEKTDIANSSPDIAKISPDIANISPDFLKITIFKNM